MRKLLSAIAILTLLFSACGGGGKVSSHLSGGDTLPLHHAENLTLVQYTDYVVATLRNPWDTLKTLHTYILVPRQSPLPQNLPEGTVIRTPLTNALVYSSVHCSLLHQLNALNRIGGVCDLKYIQLDAIQQAHRNGRIADCGNSLNPDIEQIAALRPDAILLSPFENTGGYGRVEKLGIPLVECADYMETSPLGRAEWMRFYGLLFGAEKQADSLFAEVDSCYQQLKFEAGLSSVSLSVFCELKSSSAWYVPGGRSTIGRLMADACGRYVFADDRHSGSVPLSFETVFDKAGEADVWLFKYYRPTDSMTYADLQSEYAAYAGFKAFRTRSVYACNTAVVSFYEETPFRPDYLLADYIRMLHPELSGFGGLRYYHKLTE